MSRPRLPRTLAWPLIVLSTTGCWKAPRTAGRPPDTVTAANSSHPHLVKDIPLPSDAQTHAERTLIMGQAGAWTGRLVFSTKLPPGEAFTFYQDLMEPHGWHLLSATRAGTSLLTCLRGDRVATIQIEAGFLRGSTILVTVTPCQGQSPRVSTSGTR
ncbi:MAG: hypothetical protein LWW79_13295 [Holophagaceae bacterium]|nr:hypothetical protein [Holophagaceae bacterium]